MNLHLKIDIIILIVWIVIFFIQMFFLILWLLEAKGCENIIYMYNVHRSI